MNIIVITPETAVSQEVETCEALLDLGVKRLHVRKPGVTRDELKAYLLKLDSQYYDRLSLHEHHDLVDELGLGGKHWKSNQEVNAFEGARSKSYHSFEEIKTEFSELNYGFMSPVFDSLSKPGYPARFTTQELMQKMEAYDRFPLVALGGVDESNITTVKQLGFAGAAVLGAIWQESDMKTRLNKAKEMING